MPTNSRFPVLTRRRLLAGLALAPALTWANTPDTRVRVWKSPTCGCCQDWVAHLHDNGFQVEVQEVPDTSAVRERVGIPMEYGSCHTALIDGYALEGHVPAREIRRLLRERPMAVGLAVPGMPLGSPGMDGPEYEGRKHPYEVLLVRRWGMTRVYQAYL